VSSVCLYFRIQENKDNCQCDFQCFEQVLDSFLICKEFK